MSEPHHFQIMNSGGYYTVCDYPPSAPTITRYEGHSKADAIRVFDELCATQELDGAKTGLERR